MTTSFDSSFNTTSIAETTPSIAETTPSIAETPVAETRSDFETVLANFDDMYAKMSEDKSFFNANISQLTFAIANRLRALLPEKADIPPQAYYKTTVGTALFDAGISDVIMLCNELFEGKHFNTPHGWCTVQSTVKAFKIPTPAERKELPYFYPRNLNDRDTLQNTKFLLEIIRSFRYHVTMLVKLAFRTFDIDECKIEDSRFPQKCAKGEKAKYISTPEYREYLAILLELYRVTTSWSESLHDEFSKPFISAAAEAKRMRDEFNAQKAVEKAQKNALEIQKTVFNQKAPSKPMFAKPAPVTNAWAPAPVSAPVPVPETPASAPETPTDSTFVDSKGRNHKRFVPKSKAN